MKKRVLFYLTVITSVFSLQSCVTNYVVAEPALYSKEYKTNAKLTSLTSEQYENNKKALINSFASEKNARMEAVDKAINKAKKNAAIASAVKHAAMIDTLLEEAQTYIGTPYRYGGTTRNGIDCSAFVLSVFGASAGVTLPRVAAAQAQQGERVEKEDLQKGDLVFFSHGRGRISHVGIVEDVTPDGDIKFIHAATSRGVMISSLTTDRYWAPRFRFAKRILNPEKTDIQNLANNIQ